HEHGQVADARGAGTDRRSTGPGRLARVSQAGAIRYRHAPRLCGAEELTHGGGHMRTSVFSPPEVILCNPVSACRGCLPSAASFFRLLPGRVFTPTTMPSWPP